jgi:hypothetical protein
VAERRNITQTTLTSIDPSTWAVPGAVLGAYVLTRLPLGILAGLTLGFAAGWTLRGEQDERGFAARPRRARADDDTAPPDDDKVDAMSDHSFPASDPPSYTPTRTGKPRKS